MYFLLKLVDLHLSNTSLAKYKILIMVMGSLDSPSCGKSGLRSLQRPGGIFCDPFTYSTYGEVCGEFHLMVQKVLNMT